MAISRSLYQLSLLLLGLGTARLAPMLPRVPDTHLKMLSVGLGRLLRGVEDNAQRLEGQGQRVAVEAEQAYQALESLRKQSFLVGRTHRQARKNLQLMGARGDQLEGLVQEVQKGLELVVEDQGILEHRMAQVLQKLRAASDPQRDTRPQPNASQMKVTVDNQARRLASLASEVNARHKMINRRLRSIEDLEKQLYDMRDGMPLPP